jgi:hypothetical protein
VVVQPGAIESEWSGISADNLERTAKGSAYADQIGPIATVLRNQDSAASPQVIADVVSKALHARSPRRRYAAPAHAKVFLVLRWLLPDGAWEWLVRVTVRAMMRTRARAAHPTRA